MAAVTAALRWKKLSGASSSASPRVMAEGPCVGVEVAPSTWCSILPWSVRLDSGERRIKVSLTPDGEPPGGGDPILSRLRRLAEMVQAQLADALRTLAASDLEGADAVVRAD